MGQLACWLGHLGIITLSLAMCAYCVSGVFSFISLLPRPCEVRPLLSLGSETGSGRADTLPKVTPVWDLNQALSDSRAQTPSLYSHCRAVFRAWPTPVLGSRHPARSPACHCKPVTCRALSVPGAVLGPRLHQPDAALPSTGAQSQRDLRPGHIDNRVITH